MNRARKAMGGFWMVLSLLVLALIAFVPFYFVWLTPDAASIFYMLYFGVLPALLGLGLTFGYIDRWISGTLQTSSVHTPHVADPNAAAHHGGNHHA